MVFGLFMGFVGNKETADVHLKEQERENVQSCVLSTAEPKIEKDKLKMQRCNQRREDRCVEISSLII